MTPVRLAFQELGEGPPVVVTHGLFGSGANWRSVARRVAAGHRVLLVDMRNHGASPHAPAMDYATQAADLRALLDALDLERPAVVGHSMGGKAAMRLALESPARVGALCVVDIAPALSEHDHQDVIAALRALDLDAIAGRAEADAALAGQVADPGLRGFLLQNLRSTPQGLRWRIDLDAIEAAHDELLDFPAPAAGMRYTGPCLFVRGARSDYVLDAHLPAIRSLFPAARVHTVAEAGHWTHAERPDAFLEALVPFLRNAPHAA
jgi:pimeloyl-ACP methyl ester carboxylesterase